MPNASDGMLSKTEAATTLGISERAVARHAEAGRLTAIYRKNPKGGELVFYSSEEVERLKEALPELRKKRELLAVTIEKRIREIGLTPSIVMPSMPPESEDSGEKVPITERLTLTVKAAAAYAGVGVTAIEKAIIDASLTAKPLGPRGANVVRRVDVERWVESLWEAESTGKRKR